MKKRVVSLLLCLIMALSLIPTVAFATEVENGEETTTTVEPQAATGNKVAVLEYGYGGGQGGPGGPGGGGVDNNTNVDWKQFYGYVENKYMSSAADDTDKHCKVYLDTDEWTDTTTQGVIEQKGITIVPDPGYYVKQVVIACMIVTVIAAKPRDLTAL